MNKIRQNSPWRYLLIVSCAGLASLFLYYLTGRNPFIATKLVGVDDINTRSLFYNLVNAKGISNRKAVEDSITIYSPFDGEVQDVRRIVAEELVKVSQYHPKAILFDYHFPRRLIFAEESDKLLEDAIKKCQEEGILLVIPYFSNESPHLSYFTETLPCLSGSVNIPLEEPLIVKQNNSKQVDSVQWAFQVLSQKHRKVDYYNHLAINLSNPGMPSIANNAYSDQELQDLISGKYVIFSDYQDRGDMHPILFEIPDIRKTKDNYLSGPMVLWYSVRSEIYDMWDRYIPTWISFLISLVFAFLYLLQLDKIHRNNRNDIVLNLKCFSVFMLFEIVLFPLVGLILMSCHIVLPLFFPAIILVFVDIFRYNPQNV